MRNVYHSVAAAILAAAAPLSQAQVTAAASVTGPLNSSIFNATLVVEPEFVNTQAKMWLIIIHSGTVYVHGGARGFVVYQGGEAPAYKTITNRQEGILFQGWDMSGLRGAQIYIGYGHHLDDMLQNGRYLLVHQVPAAVTPAPPPAPPSPPQPPPVTDPVARYSGRYICANEYYIERPVTISMSSGRAVADVTSLYDIPVYQMSLPFKEIDRDGDRVYSNNTLPLQRISLDTTPGANYPVAIGYASSPYNIKVWVCRR